ncbi:transmembrane protein 79-like [Argopecten irradians]|uniref:transmembrane protein 79-like n=1 Tax=Argopecten irradians TaxID=31199 RepID=UPI00371FD6B8
MASEKTPSPSSNKSVINNFRFKVSMATTIVYFIVGYNFFPFNLPVMDTVFDRVIFTLRWQIFGGMTLLMGMVGVMVVRVQSEATADPVYGNAEHLTQLPRNILQNTLEQFIFHFIGQIVLCTYLTEESMKVIPLLVVLFVIARIIYKIAYQIQPMIRIYGFIPTLFPTIATYTYCTYCMLVYGPGYGL